MVAGIGCCKLALDQGVGGTLEGPAAHFRKSPPLQHSDERARQLAAAFMAAPAAAPAGDGAAPTRTRGDEAGVEDVSRPTL